MTITGQVDIGERAHIATGAAIFGGAGVRIGAGASISPGVKIFTATDDLESAILSNPQVENRVVKSGPVEVGAGTAIGANSVVLPGVKIGSNCRIGALSMVSCDIPDGEIWAGIPARFLRKAAS